MLQPQDITTLTRALRDSGSREIAGFLLGGLPDEQELVLVRNWVGTFGRVIVGPSEVLRIERYAQRRRLHIQAFIHSHRSTLELSAMDQLGLRATGIPWIVVKLDGDELEFKVHDNQADSLRV